MDRTVLRMRAETGKRLSIEEIAEHITGNADVRYSAERIGQARYVNQRFNPGYAQDPADHVAQLKQAINVLAGEFPKVMPMRFNPQEVVDLLAEDYKRRFATKLRLEKEAAERKNRDRR